MIDVSVLIVNYNVKDYLLQCLRSIEKSEGAVTYEVIVVDNCSQDGSLEYLEPLFPSVRFVALPDNIGFGRANNVGLELCAGSYVLFLNPDTILSPDTLSAMKSYMDAHPTVGAAGCKVLNPDGSFQLACRRGLPTPWASFCKLFGLQTLFPSSPLFARYNLTYKPIDETYAVDALIGAFMFTRRDVVTQQKGFDPAFFMYGEDVDLCYRIQKSGWTVMYVPTTTIVHYKGESTRRSSINEVRVFYEAMEIFANKHFGGSRLFLAFLRIGIRFRAVVERLLRARAEVVAWMVDMISINGALLTATTVRFGSPLGFPDYAYPLVPIVVSATATASLLAMGEYVEYKPTVRRSLVALLITFFGLSSLTYFFKEFAFSRGVLLMTIGITAVLYVLSRGVMSVVGSRRFARGRRILLVGINEQSTRIAEALSSAEHRHASVIGVVGTSSFAQPEYSGLRVLGDTGYLDRILDATKAQEVILTDETQSQDAVVSMMKTTSLYGARFHIASEYDDVVTARIINDVAGVEPSVTIPPLLRIRNRAVKRTADLVLSSLVLLLVAPILTLFGRKDVGKQWRAVFVGSMSIVGTYADGVDRIGTKQGVTGLVHVSGPANLSKQTIVDLNDFYAQQYSAALDIEIILKHIIRRIRGKHNNTGI